MQSKYQISGIKYQESVGRQQLIFSFLCKFDSRYSFRGPRKLLPSKNSAKAKCFDAAGTAILGFGLQVGFRSTRAQCTEQYKNPYLEPSRFKYRPLPPLYHFKTIKPDERYSKMPVLKPAWFKIGILI